MNCVQMQGSDGRSTSFGSVLWLLRLYRNVILKKVNNKEFSSEKYA